MLAVGARLRVRPTARAPWQYGVYQGVSGDSLQLATANRSQSQRYALATVSAIEVYRRRAGERSHHAAVGMFTGALGGVVVLVLAVRHCEATSHHTEGPPCGIGYAGLPVALVEGGGLGAIVGAVWPVRHWQRVSIVPVLPPSPGPA